ncbi:MauE/DoxX family redox-associated membrane protein [Priestia aryabhattai]|uniref:MauE/DoxX family redox-associated membrane protein n=1 Tax=Priestia aryabhattai TaxID=412384 RepID=UPI003D2D27B1
MRKITNHSSRTISIYICIIFISSLMLYSGITKIINIYQFINTLSYYDYIPHNLYFFIGYTIPIVEVLIGILIWLRPLRKKVIISYGILIILFIILLIVHYGSYMPYGCGCFGQNKPETINYLIIIRDGICILPVIIYKLLHRSLKV